MKKNDYYLLIILLILGFLVSFLYTRISQKRDNPSFCVILVDGEEYKRVSLSEDIDICVDTPDGFNIVSVKEGSVFVSKADCKGNDCIKLGKISHQGENLVCVPHKVVIKIVSSEGLMDTYAY